MSKLTFNQVFTAIETGETITDPPIFFKCERCGHQNTKEEKAKNLTLKIIAVRALLTVEPNDKTKAEDKYERGKLAEIIMESKDSLDLKSEEITLLKDLIGKAFAPQIVFQAFEMLDPKKE